MSQKFEEIQRNYNFQSNASDGVRISSKTRLKNCKGRNHKTNDGEPEKQTDITTDLCEKKTQLAKC